MTKPLSDYPPPGVEVRLIERYVDIRRIRILEIGSGDGRLTREVARRAASVTAIEPDRAKVAQARWMAETEGIKNVDFRVDSADTLRLNQQFDVALFSWSL